MTDPFTPARLAAIQARLDAATSPPWEAGSISVLASDGQTICRMGRTDAEAENAELIAHAPTDLRDLLAEVERLERENLKLRSERDYLQGFREGVAGSVTR